MCFFLFVLYENRLSDSMKSTKACDIACYCMLLHVQNPPIYQKKLKINSWSHTFIHMGQFHALALY